jgi:hypothetical protein
MSQTYLKHDIAMRYDAARALPEEGLTLAMETLQNLLLLKRVKSDEAFMAGMRRMAQWVAEKPAGQAVYEPVDLFIFQVNQ